MLRTVQGEECMASQFHGLSDCEKPCDRPKCPKCDGSGGSTGAYSQGGQDYERWDNCNLCDGERFITPVRLNWYQSQEKYEGKMEWRFQGIPSIGFGALAQYGLYHEFGIFPIPFLLGLIIGGGELVQSLLRSHGNVG